MTVAAHDRGHPRGLEPPRRHTAWKPLVGDAAQRTVVITAPCPYLTTFHHNGIVQRAGCNGEHVIALERFDERRVLTLQRPGPQTQLTHITRSKAKHLIQLCQ